MMRSMFSGVAGLKAHQVRMDIIGNNIANVNTVGYKSSRMTFSEIYSQTVRGAGASNGGIGGTNPQQIGLGVTVGSIDVNMSKGSIQKTESTTDMMVDGNGFFVLANDEAAQNKFYSRAGNFVLDSKGFLVAPNGFKVLGMDGKAIQINKSETKNAVPTTKIMLGGNIKFGEEKAYTTTVDVMDSLGKPHMVSVTYDPDIIKSAGAVAMDPLDPLYQAAPAVNPAVNYSYRKITFTNNDSVPATTVPVAPANLFVKFNQNGDAVKMTALTPVAGPPATFAAPEVAIPAVNNLTIVVPGAANIVIPINDNILYENGVNTVPNKRMLKQYATSTDVKSVAIDGNTSGSLNSFSIGGDGKITGIFTNGKTSELSTIMLADFDNPAGLMKMGANLFSVTNNSGAARFGAPTSGSMGGLAPGALEMSNVDLAQEFTDMITTQRGFQANSKIITTSDEILGELVNLKR
jgi:flagellar hook protein FlgE